MENSNDSDDLKLHIPLMDGHLKNKMFYTLDIDSLYGDMPFEIFKLSFKQTIKLSIDNSPKSVYKRDNIIKTSHFFKDTDFVARIQHLPHLRIGTATDFGNLDVFLILTNFGKTIEQFSSFVYMNIKKSLKRLGQDTPTGFLATVTDIVPKNKTSQHFEGIKVTLNHEDLIKVLEYAFHEEFQNKKIVIFVETWGNKTSTITNCLNFKKIEKKVFTSFSSLSKPYLYMDVCYSSTFGHKTVTFPKPEFFKKTKILPTHAPLFSDSALNCNRSTVDPSTGKSKTIGVFKNLFKVNFYSTYSYSLKFEKTKSYIFPMTMNLLLTNLYGHLVYANKDKFTNLYSKFEEVEGSVQNGITDGTCVYRTELRCRWIHAESSLKKLKLYLKPKYFGYYDSTNFFSIMQLNINNLIDLIKTGNSRNMFSTPESLVKSLIAEYILKTIYLTGTKTNSTLSESKNNLIKEYIKTYEKSVGVLKNAKKTIEKIYSTMSELDKCTVLGKQMKFAFGSRSFKKDLLEHLVEVSFIIPEQELTEFEFMEIMLNNFVIERTTDKNSDLSFLKEPADDETILSIHKILPKLFLKGSSKKSKILMLFFDVFKKRFNFSDDEALKKIANFMNVNQIHSLYKYSSQKNFTRCKIDFKLKKVEKNLRSSKGEILPNFIKDFAKKVTVSRNARTDEDEMVRYMHSMFKHSYSNSRFIDVLNDFSYGLFPVRRKEWLKNKQSQLFEFLTKKKFLNLMKKIKEWSPEKFSIDDRLSYMQANGVVLSASQKENYIQLVNLDNESWWNSDIVDKIQLSSLYDIFFGVVLKLKAYKKSDKQSIEEWSKKEFIFSKPEQFKILEQPFSTPETFITCNNTESTYENNLFPQSLISKSESDFEYSENLIDRKAPVKTVYMDYDKLQENPSSSLRLVDSCDSEFPLEYFEKPDQKIQTFKKSFPIKKIIHKINIFEELSSSFRIVDSSEMEFTLPIIKLKRNKSYKCPLELVENNLFGRETKEVQQFSNFLDYSKNLLANNSKKVSVDNSQSYLVENSHESSENFARAMLQSFGPRNNGFKIKASITEKPDSFLDYSKNEINYDNEFGFDNNKIDYANDFAFDNNEINYDNDFAFEKNEIEVPSFENNFPLIEDTSIQTYIPEIKLPLMEQTSIENINLEIKLPLIEIKVKSLKKSVKQKKLENITSQEKKIIVTISDAEKFIIYDTKLFKKYRYSNFNIFRGRDGIFNQKTRPAKQNWENFISSLQTTRKLSKNIGNRNYVYYRYNLEIEKNKKYLDMNYVVDSIKNYLKKTDSIDDKAYNFRNAIFYNLRPLLSDFINYLRDLVKDGHLKITKIINDEEYFSLVK